MGPDQNHMSSMTMNRFTFWGLSVRPETGTSNKNDWGRTALTLLRAGPMWFSAGVLSTIPRDC